MLLGRSLRPRLTARDETSTPSRHIARLARTMTHVSSRQHPLVAACRELARRPAPSGDRLLLDGEHLVADAYAAGLTFELVAVDESRMPFTAEGHVAHKLALAGIEIVTTSASVLAAMSPVRTPSGIVAIVQRSPISASEVCAVPDAFVLALADIQDPGNVGSLLRAAEAGGATGALVCGASANPFSWKAVRGSMGSVLRLPIAYGGSPDDVFDETRKAGLRNVASVARGGRPPNRIDWSAPLALWLGGEGAGLSERVVAASNDRVTIPMAVSVESLNVAVAGGILVYAAGRHS